MVDVRYDVLGAMFSNVVLHPQDDMKQLGFTVVRSEPVPIADCWIFRVEDYDFPIPDYIKEIYGTFSGFED